MFAKNSEGPQLAPGAFRAQPLRAAHSSYNMRRLTTLFEPAQGLRVAVTTLEVWDVSTKNTDADRNRASSHRIWAKYFYYVCGGRAAGSEIFESGPILHPHSFCFTVIPDQQVHVRPAGKTSLECASLKLASSRPCVQ